MRAVITTWMLALLPVLACAGGCAPNAPVRRTRASDARAAVAAPQTSERVPSGAAEPPVSEEQLAQDLDRRLCSERRCCVSALEDAGKDGKGRALVVATVDMAAASCVAPASAPAQDGGQEEEDCHAYEVRLVAHAAGKVDAQQLLVAMCNDGYGAAGIGEDETAVDPVARTFTHGRSGGSAWRWGDSTTVGLDPLRIVSRSDTSFWTLDQEGTFASSEWNMDTFAGSTTVSTPDCDGRRKQEAARQRDPTLTSDEAAASKSMQSVPIPRVQLPPAFVADAWRTTALAACAAFIDGDQRGFAIHGGPGKADDATLRVVVSSDGVLFAEISDDLWTTQGKSWVKEDHLELWLAPDASGAPNQSCDDPAASPATARDPSRQWGIRISDGAVFAGFGSPRPLANVEVARAGSSARIKIPLRDQPADAWQALAVVYSDSDDGTQQERLIATSQVERGHAGTLGHMIGIDASAASCVTDVATGALRIVRPPLQLHPDQAVID